MARPGESVQVVVSSRRGPPRDAEAGLYRIVKDFRAAGEHVRVAGRFEVEG